MMQLGGEHGHLIHAAYFLAYVLVEPGLHQNMDEIYKYTSILVHTDERVGSTLWICETVLH
jgi:hypothetical protein